MSVRQQLSTLGHANGVAAVRSYLERHEAASLLSKTRASFLPEHSDDYDRAYVDAILSAIGEAL